MDAILTVGLVLGLVLGAQEPQLVAGQDVALPKRLVFVEPIYPASASGIQGLVVIEFVVDTKGEPRRLRVLRSIPALDAAAVEAVEKWKYEPTLVDGEVREVVLRAPVPMFAKEKDRLFAIEGLAGLGGPRAATGDQDASEPLARLRGSDPDRGGKGFGRTSIG